MSENKGKTGEMIALSIVSAACHVTDKLEVSRPSKTNSADLGLDLSLSGKKKDIETILTTATPNRTQSEAMNNIGDDVIVKARIDSKNYDGKITKAAMDKFVGEICLHPDSNYHIMWGGTHLTKGAKESASNANERLKDKGITIEYINKEGIYNLSEAYPAIRPGNPNQPIEEIGNEPKK